MTTNTGIKKALEPFLETAAGARGFAAVLRRQGYSYNFRLADAGELNGLVNPSRHSGKHELPAAANPGGDIEYGVASGAAGIDREGARPRAFA